MKRYEKLVVGTNSLVPTDGGKYIKYINFDNAATTPAFVTVVEDLLKFLPYYSSVHRGMGYKSQISTKVYENGRKVVADFLKADLNKSSIIFVKNTTEAINKLANMFYDKYKDCVVLSTGMEHHSNDLPWRKFDIKYVDVDKNGRLDMGDLEEKLKKYKDKVKLVTVTGASNVTGYKNNIYDIATLSHFYGAKILVDGAQRVPHSPINVKDYDSPSHIDYIAFSAHKMYAPFGIGVLVGPKDELDDMNPDHVGGGTVEVVTHEFVKWKESPEKDEAGSPNILGVLALSSAITTIQKIGMGNIENYEKKLLNYTINHFKNIKGLQLYKDDSGNDVAIVPFNIEGIYHETLSKILSYRFGIGVRSGCFCAQPYIQKLLNVSQEETEKIAKYGGKRPGMVRVSLGLYNSIKEIDYLIYAINDIIDHKDWYLYKYDN